MKKAPPSRSVPTTAAPGAAPALRLRLHGLAEVTSSTGATLPLRGRAAALVALAALQPGISRERAAQWLWPDAPHPRQNLRQQLLRFRQALGHDLLAGAEHLALADGVLLEPAAPGALLLAEDASIDTASANPDSSDWAQWLQRQRHSHQQAQAQPLLQALAQAENDGDLDAALRHAQALHALAPQDEGPHQALMRVHYLRGEAAAGIRVYSALTEHLAAHLGRRPSSASDQLANLLGRSGTAPHSQGTADADTGPATAPPTATAVAIRQTLRLTLKRPPHLVGRSREQAATLHAWARGQAVLLLGEAGLGKSRLMAELLATPPLAAGWDALRAAHPVTLHAAGRPGDRAAPYTTLSRLLQPLAGAAQGLQSIHRGALAVVGLVDTSAPAMADAPPLPPGALQRALAALLQQGDVHTVAVDDLHFADDATLDLVAGQLAAPLADDAAAPGTHTAVQAGAAPRRWLLASRPAEASSAAQRLVEGLTELQRLHMVTLSALEAEDVALLIGSLDMPGLFSARGSATTPSPPAVALLHPAPALSKAGPSSNELATALVRHTGGNPLFLLETLKLGLADGSLLAGRLPHPQAVGSLIERRLRQLSPRALALARVAAVAGVDFSVGLAETATATPAVELADAWVELEQAQVLRDSTFAHDLVCDAVLRTLPSAVAKHLHGVAAGWLEEKAAEPARVAQHWLAAAQPQRALAPLLQAAQRASHALRPAEALVLYEQARAIHQENGEAHAEAAVLFTMTECLRLMEDRAPLRDQTSDGETTGGDQTQRVLSRLQAIASDDGDRARAWLAASRLANETRHMDAAVQHARQALACAQAYGDAELTGRSRLQLAVVLGEQMQGDEAQLHLEAARSWALAAPSAVRNEFLHCTALVSMHLENFPAAVQAMEQLLADPEACADPQDGLQLWGNLAVAQAGMGALRAALVSDEKRRALAARHGVGGVSQNYLELNAATLLMNLGRYREALGFLEQAEARAVPDQAMLHLRWATLMFYVGQHARALQHITRSEAADTVHPIIKLTAGLLRLQVQATGQGPGNPGPVSESLLARSAELAEQDRRHAAWVRRELVCSEFAAPAQGLVHAEQAIERAARAHLHGLRLAGHTLRIEHALALGDLQRAVADVPLVLTLREQFEPTSLYRARVGWAVVRALQAQGDPQAQHLLRAEVAWVQQTARDHVPSAFVASFLERNPVNRALLAAATQQRLPG